VDGIGAANEGAHCGFVEFSFGFDLAGLAEHGGRIEERESTVDS
jgi:hypothetical protein